MIIVFFCVIVPLIGGAFSLETSQEEIEQGAPFSHFKFPRSIQLTPKLFEGCEAAWASGFRYKGIFPIALPKKDDDLTEAWRFIVCNNSETRASTVILLRKDGGEDFNKSFDEYEKGFGSAKTDYFLGLKHIWNLTKHGFTEMRVTLMDDYGATASIVYPVFRLKPAPKYSLGLSAPGDSELPDDLFEHRNLPFTAPGKELIRADGISCAGLLKAGWWFRPRGNCASALLTGTFTPNKMMCRSRRPFPLCDGVYWSDWSGFQTLKLVFMEVSKKMV